MRRRVERVPTTRGFDFTSDADVTVNGWDGWSGGAPEDGPSLSLPSFSGRLAEFPELLRYPLKLGPASRVALRPAMPTRWRGVSDDLAAVLDGPRACPCIQVDGARGGGCGCVLGAAARPVPARATSPRAARPELARAPAWGGGGRPGAPKRVRSVVANRAYTTSSSISWKWRPTIASARARTKAICASSKSASGSSPGRVRHQNFTR